MSTMEALELDPVLRGGAPTPPLHPTSLTPSPRLGAQHYHTNIEKERAVDRETERELVKEEEHQDNLIPTLNLEKAEGDGTSVKGEEITLRSDTSVSHERNEQENSIGHRYSTRTKTNPHRAKSTIVKFRRPLHLYTSPNQSHPHSQPIAQHAQTSPMAPLTQHDPVDETVTTFDLPHTLPTPLEFTREDLVHYRQGKFKKSVEERKMEEGGTDWRGMSVADGAWKKWADVGGIPESLGVVGRYTHDKEDQCEFTISLPIVIGWDETGYGVRAEDSVST